MKSAAKIGHNSASTKDQIKDFVAKYVKCDERSQELNDDRAAIRTKVEELGLDTKAFQDAVSRAKKDRRKKEGYDESLKVIVEALGEMNQDDLFAYMDKREEEKEKAREAKKEKADKFKDAPDRKPKNAKVVSGKDAASGEKPGQSIGQQQAAAYLAAHGGGNA